MPQSMAIPVAPPAISRLLIRYRRTPRFSVSCRLLKIHFSGRMCRKYMSVVSALLRNAVMNITKNGYRMNTENRITLTYSATRPSVFFRSFRHPRIAAQMVLPAGIIRRNSAGRIEYFIAVSIVTSESPASPSSRPTQTDCCCSCPHPWARAGRSNT